MKELRHFIKTDKHSHNKEFSEDEINQMQTSLNSPRYRTYPSFQQRHPNNINKPFTRDETIKELQYEWDGYNKNRPRKRK